MLHLKVAKRNKHSTKSKEVIVHDRRKTVLTKTAVETKGLMDMEMEVERDVMITRERKESSEAKK